MSAVVRLRMIVARDREAADRRPPAFPLVFRRRSSVPRELRREVFRTLNTLIPKPHSPLTGRASREDAKVCFISQGS
jgi:hypothetical protein